MKRKGASASVWKKRIMKMERNMKWIALLLAAVMLISCSGAFAEDAVLAEVNGVQIMKSEVEENIIQFYYYGYIDDPGDYAGMVDILVENTLMLQMLSDQGWYDFTEEEEEAIRADAQATLNEYVEEYVTYYLSEDSDEAREALRLQAREFYSGYEDVIYSQVLDDAAYDKWYASVAASAVTDEDVRAAYAAYAAEDKATYRDDIEAYEIDCYCGYTVFYIPEGYRCVLRVLLTVEEQLMEAYTQAQAAWEETLDDNNAPTEATAAAAAVLEQAKQAVLASVSNRTDAVYAALEAGASFEDVILQYGEDPFMTEEYGGLETGYPVHRNSIMYDAAFIAGAFGDDMTAFGDYTGPIISEDGVSILCYLCDLPSGPVELTDDMYEDIRAYLEENAVYTVYTAQMDEY
ncbi:MAG: hypothetical protein CW338_10395, partial [Clostridiales bacterium]|nr:hypothetical protein [Clostridiales bacterium]